MWAYCKFDVLTYQTKWIFAKINVETWYILIIAGFFFLQIYYFTKTVQKILLGF